MANINDFKIIKQRSKKYFERAGLVNNFSDVEKQRLGFYFLVLECVTNVKEISEIKEMIIDSDFCDHFYGKGNDDLGVDAVYINDDKRIIQLFNFKYRENFKEHASTKEADVYDSSRFLAAVAEENTRKLDKFTKQKVEDIIDRLNGEEIYNTELYMVANVNHSFSMSPALELYKDNFDIEIKNITLDDIIGFISNEPSNVKASLLVDADSILTYETSKYSTNKSFLIKLSLADLVRITCTSQTLREDNSISEYEKIRNAKLEMSLLYENVRGYLGDTKYNKNIVNTINEKPENFFMYNNGITLVAETVSSTPKNGKKKHLISIGNYQIVNGGQTIRSIYKFCEETFDPEKLAAAEILVRLFQTDTDDVLKNDIAEYTNSQNAINSFDLKSVSKIQRQIEEYLAEKNILYIRKAGDVGKENKKYDFVISKEKLAQIIYSSKGYPVKATNKKIKLFEDYYKEIFPDDLDVETLEPLIKQYINVKAKYEASIYDNYDQKYLYIIYILHKAPSKSVDDSIDILEKTLDNFEVDSELSKSRKLLKVNFQQTIDNVLIPPNPKDNTKKK